MFNNDPLPFPFKFFYSGNEELYVGYTWVKKVEDVQNLLHARCGVLLDSEDFNGARLSGNPSTTILVMALFRRPRYFETTDGNHFASWLGQPNGYDYLWDNPLVLQKGAMALYAQGTEALVFNKRCEYTGMPLVSTIFIPTQLIVTAEIIPVQHWSSMATALVLTFPGFFPNLITKF